MRIFYKIYVLCAGNGVIYDFRKRVDILIPKGSTLYLSDEERGGLPGGLQIEDYAHYDGRSNSSRWIQADDLYMCLSGYCPEKRDCSTILTPTNYALAAKYLRDNGWETF